MLSPVRRRVIQAFLYEVFAIAAVGPALSWFFERSGASSFLLAFIMSTVALTWSLVFNTWFERWEATRVKKGRSALRRLVHGLGFEGGLAVMLVPLMAFWFGTSLLTALLAQAGVFVFFLVYSIGFTWTFDRVFGLPVSSQSTKYV
ncbi:MAG: PACE efflux transporter [Polyangiaceae bacterium]